jgi:hypothetical protein
MSPEAIIFSHEPEKVEIPQDKMTQLLMQVARARDLEASLERLDQQMSDASKELQGILGGWQCPGSLVTLLQEAGPVPVTEMTLEDGTKIVVDEELKPPSMAAGSKYREVVVTWAKESGHGGAVKGEVTVNVPVGKEALADEVLKTAEGLGLQGKKVETINASTLGALLRELLEDGADVPLDKLGVFVFRKAKISTAKVGK